MRVQYDKDSRQFICSGFPIGPITKIPIMIFNRGKLYGAVDNVTLEKVYRRYIKSIYEN